MRRRGRPSKLSGSRRRRPMPVKAEVSQKATEQRAVRPEV
jgi:hypothetical protein